MIVAIALVGAVALSGCGIQRAGVAATIGDEQLTESTVDQRTEAYFDAYPAVVSGLSRGQVASDTVQNFLRAIIVDRTAADNDITVSETEIDSFIEQFGGSKKLYLAIATQGVPPNASLGRLEVRSAILQGKLQDLAGPDADDFARAAALTDRTAATIAKTKIEVNPRFGVWGGSAVDVVNGSLSLTEAELVPTPTPTTPAG